MSVRAQAEPSLDREWLLRALIVLQSPRAVFAALRDDSQEAADARQEPVLALLLLAGAAAVLASPVARTLLDDPARDGVIVAVWAFFGGLVYGVSGFWLGGALVHAASRALGGQGSYRRARHLITFAAAPLALSLVTLWPVALAVFRGGLFRSGGSGHAVVGAAGAAFAVWSLVLVAIGIRSVHAWTWARSLAATALAAAPVALLVLLQQVA
ncbi:MAG: Yip1 family protein [Gaiellaceae bacterium]